MNKENQRGYKAPPKTQQIDFVNRPFFSLPRDVWSIVDRERSKSGLSAGTYIANLILKASK